MGGPHHPAMNGHHHGGPPPPQGMMNGAQQQGALRRVASSPNFGKHLENATHKSEEGRGGDAKHAGAGGDGNPARRIGTLTLEERRARILRYRQKRHERNFRKRIKYNCRKTLADSRPRIRGRFARNDEIEELLKQKKLEEEKRAAGETGSGSSSSQKSSEENRNSSGSDNDECANKDNGGQSAAVNGDKDKGKA